MFLQRHRRPREGFQPSHKPPAPSVKTLVDGKAFQMIAILAESSKTVVSDLMVTEFHSLGQYLWLVSKLRPGDQSTDHSTETLYD